MSGRRATSRHVNLKSLRERAAELFKEQAAILILANDPQRLSPDQISANVEHLNTLKTHKELQTIVDSLIDTIANLREVFEVKVSRAQLFSLMDWIQKTAVDTQMCYMPLGMLSEDIGSYSRLGLPPHARISIDPRCLGRDYPGGFEIRLLEASLFEDMCALFNECLASIKALPSSKSRGSIDWKRAAKKHAALARATVSAAFYFVEAFINCAAADHVYLNGKMLSEKDRALLTEWDETRKRSKFISTRDKLVQYPRIITGATFPPIDENNCPELDFFVTTAKDFRDAIVHASVSSDPGNDSPKKEHLFMGLKQSEVEKIVDAAIILAGKVGTAISGRPPAWLHQRDETGFFPDRVFE